jgi:hypothetical protein
MYLAGLFHDVIMQANVPFLRMSINEFGMEKAEIQNRRSGRDSLLETYSENTVLW